METLQKTTPILDFSNTYIEDMIQIKNIFLQTHNNENGITEDFGLPFLTIRENGIIKAFASLIVDFSNVIRFRILYSEDFSFEDKEKIHKIAADYFSKKTSPNFKNPIQLNASIQNIINWLND